jgi:hypothetical protein
MRSGKHPHTIHNICYVLHNIYYLNTDEPEHLLSDPESTEDMKKAQVSLRAC